MRRQKAEGRRQKAEGRRQKAVASLLGEPSAGRPKNSPCIKVEQAMKIISESRSISKADAYKRIREKSMSTKQSIASIAEAIITANGI